MSEYLDICAVYLAEYPSLLPSDFPLTGSHVTSSRPGTFAITMACPPRPSSSVYTHARRRPELTPCYKIVQEHLSTFIADREAEGRPLPDYVIQEFEAYLECGIPAYGFLRLKCEDCDEEKIVAFS